MRYPIFLLCICFSGIFGRLQSQESPQIEPALEKVFSSFPAVRDFTVSAQGDEAYFTIQSTLEEVSVIGCIKKNKKSWGEPSIASFSGKYKDLEPFLSPDGLRLYFVSDRPLDANSDKPKDFDIWYVSRKSIQDTWSAPVNLGAPVNTEHNEFYPSLSANQNLYFTSDAPNSKGKDDIFFAKWEKNQYTAPASLNDSINSDGYEFNAFIAPDESYLIYTIYQAADGLGSGDLYISLQDARGYWTKARNLGIEINSNKMDYCPFVHGATQTLYFTSRRSTVYTPASGFRDMPELLQSIQAYPNGQSRIYQVQLKNSLFKN